MRITDLFIKRPVLAIVVNLVILIAGLQAVRTLSVRQFPRTDIAVVNVTTAYVGANADLVRGFITSPLERVIASADGIDYVESSSTQGISNITLTPRTGAAVAAAFPVRPGDDVMLVTDAGRLIRVPADQVRITGRSAQGVTLFRVDSGERVTAVFPVMEDDTNDEGTPPESGVQEGDAGNG